jgi:hypothetical protein
MALNKYDKEKLFHDLKRIAKGFRILRDEDKKDRREFMCQLLQDEFDRLYQDIEEMTEQMSGKDNE